MNLAEQRQKLLNDFYEKYYYPNMHRGDPLEVEFIISPKCNLACQYCYVNRYYYKCYPDSMYDEDLVVENVMKVLKAYTKKGLAPTIDLFSGEFFAQKVGYRLMEELYQYYKDLPLNLRPKEIVVPTNFTFICNDELVAKIEDYLVKFYDIEVYFYLSASIEGKYMEENRPVSHDIDIPINVVRDDAYYDKALEFCNKWGFGFHPMVAATGIENWIKNFDWWQAQFEKHQIAWDSIYLLEVRNGEDWTDKQIDEYQQFLRHIFYFAYNKFNQNLDAFLEWMFDFSDKTEDEIMALNEKYGCTYWDRGFNILNNSYMKNTNGITCNIQQHTAIRCADLMIVPCHRLMYPQFYFGKYVIDDDYNITIDVKNAEMAVSFPMINSKVYPRCGQCPINHCCISGCLGSQYESTNDCFTPIPTVCRMMYAKLDALNQCLKEIGAWDKTLRIAGPQIANQLINFESIRKDAYRNAENSN